MKEAIPAISIRQPWAELILAGKKTVELRTYDTKYRGEIWLHTGQKVDEVGMEQFKLENLYTGGYVGKITLEMVLPLDESRWAKWAERYLSGGEFVPGFYGWVLSNPKRFQNQVPGPGQLKLFWPEREILAALELAN